MTALITPSQTLPQATFDVYIKPFDGSGTPDAGGVLDSASKGDNGWTLFNNLRAGKVRFASWPSSGIAGMDLVAPDGSVHPFELGLFEFQPDDQVRIIMHPPTEGTTFAPDLDLTGQEDTGIVIFDGTLQRAAFNVKGATDKADEFERFNLIAVDAPSIDNLHPDHLVRGRFYADDDTPTPVILDGPSVPCVFNAGEMPNMLPNATVSVGGGDLTITSNLFTNDNDVSATYWTLKEALKHLITCWLFGIDQAAGGDAQGDLDRSATIEPETFDALFASPGGDNPARWAGLDDLLPETDVQGLGVFDAIDRVCRAGGYRSAVLPPMGRSLPDGSSVDRLYLLRIWREGAGPLNELRLQDREFISGGQSAEDLLANNTVSAMRGIRDTSGVRNSISAVGRTLVETTVQLKPMWKPGDMATPAGTFGEREQAVPIDQSGDPYHSQHVKGGATSEDYWHVGRMWGLDETGAFKSSSLGYSTGDYAHPDGGFDWLAQLQITGSDNFTAARTANGVTTPVRMSKRMRRPLKLSRPEAVSINQAFRLDVSENGGTSWHQLPSSAASLLTDGYFGIMLRADNLATVNRETFGASTKNKTPLAAESWWGLLATGTNLRFRITCLVELDVAARFDAPIDAGAWTRTPAAALIEKGVTEVWQAPSSVIGDQTWKRLDDNVIAASAAGADRTDNLKDLAERTRDKLGQMRYSITVAHWLMDPSLYAVGDVIQGVAGRNVGFGLFNANTGETRFPSVVTMTIDAYPAQNIILDITDEAARRGV